MLARMWNNLNSHTLLLNMQDAIAILKNRKCLIKLYIHFTHYSDNLLIDIYPRGMRICSHTNLFINVHNSFIRNNQKSETQMSISW